METQYRVVDEEWRNCFNYRVQRPQVSVYRASFTGNECVKCVKNIITLIDETTKGRKKKKKRRKPITLELDSTSQRSSTLPDDEKSLVSKQRK